jgi:hypothetical protein
MGLSRSALTRWPRTIAYALLATGVVLVIFAYAGVNDARFVVQEVSYLITGGIAGVLALGVGLTLLFCSDLSEEFAHIDRIAADLSRRLSQEQPRPEEPEVVAMEATVVVTPPAAAGPATNEREVPRGTLRSAAR